MSKIFFNLNKYKKKINIGFFTSKGGVSDGNYFSLNCSKSSKDNSKKVRENIKIAINNIGIKNKKLKLINQTHSNKIFSISRNNFNKNLYGDGIITKEKDIALAILTADCAPIFLFDIEQNIICSIHSGWKGTLKNIAGKSVRLLKEKGLKSKNIVAVVGPCLGFKNFEVDKKFKLKFIKKDSRYNKYFKSKNKNKDLFNLRGLINHQLRIEGLKNINNINRDTYKNSHIFFSHRRATHQNKIYTGRMINIISFKD